LQLEFFQLFNIKCNVLRRAWSLSGFVNQKTVGQRLIATIRLPYLPAALITSAGIWLVPGDLYLFSFSVAISTSAALDLGTNGSAISI
jgi:hypothetical protein